MPTRPWTIARRYASRLSQLGIDLLMVGGSFFLAYLVRFDWNPPAVMLDQWQRLLPYVLVMKLGVLLLAGVHRFAWRYIGLREVSKILQVTAICSGALLAVRLGASAMAHPPQWLVVPIGVILIDFALSFLALAGVRILRRIMTERAVIALRRGAPKPAITRTILVGAGQAGLLVAKELLLRPDLGIVPVAFVDDDRLKQGSEIHGVKIMGVPENIPEICDELGAHQVLITIAGASGIFVRRITALCETRNLPVKIVPGLYELVDGSPNLGRIRSVAIDDLLRRDPVVLDEDLIGKWISGQTVLVTGAGGSIGSELCRQICRFKPKNLILAERTENSLFTIHGELSRAYPVALNPCLVDVTDGKRVRQILEDFRPTTIFHAAAHKHVPLMELNPCEAIKNNVGGTRTLADAAADFGVARFVLVSTDKAVNPSSVMGASKRLAELYLRAIGPRSKTAFIVVRFGNVLDSAGSVVPTFREQISRGGPVTVTHPEMTRYFMTIPEASLLVLQAASMGVGNEVFILDMGEPVRVLDLAHDLIRLSGLRPEVDIKISITGVRPGEKLHEELTPKEERATRSSHPKVLMARPSQPDYAETMSLVEEFMTVALANDEVAVRDLLQQCLLPTIRTLPPEKHAAETPAFSLTEVERAG